MLRASLQCNLERLGVRRAACTPSHGAFRPPCVFGRNTVVTPNANILRHQSTQPAPPPSNFTPAPYPSAPTPEPFTPAPFSPAPGGPGGQGQGSGGQRQYPKGYKWLLIGTALGMLSTMVFDPVSRKTEEVRRAIQSLDKPNGPEAAHTTTSEIKTFSTVLDGRRINICTYNDSVSARAKGPVVVINASTIAAARPLALALVKSTGCVVVAYTHAGLVCDNEAYHAGKVLRQLVQQTKNQAGDTSPPAKTRPPNRIPVTQGPRPHECKLIESRSGHIEDATGPFAPFQNLIQMAGHTMMQAVGGMTAITFLHNEPNPLYSSWFTPPPPIGAPPTSDWESRELVSVLAAADVSQALLVATHYNWMSTLKAALRNPNYCAGLVLIDPLLPGVDPLRSIVDWPAPAALPALPKRHPASVIEDAIKEAKEGGAGAGGNASLIEEHAAVVGATTAAAKEGAGARLAVPLTGTLVGLAPMMPLEEAFSPAFCNAINLTGGKLAGSDKSQRTSNDFQNVIAEAAETTQRQVATMIAESRKLPVTGRLLMDAIYSHQCLVGSGLDPIGTVMGADLLGQVVNLHPVLDKDSKGADVVPGNFKDISFAFGAAATYASPNFGTSRIAATVPPVTQEAMSQAIQSKHMLSDSGEKVGVNHFDGQSNYVQAAAGMKHLRDMAITHRLLIDLQASRGKAGASGKGGRASEGSGSENSTNKAIDDGQVEVPFPADAVYFVDVIKAYNDAVLEVTSKGIRLIPAAEVNKDGKSDGSKAIEAFSNVAQGSGGVTTSINNDARLTWVHHQLESLRIENYINRLVAEFDLMLNVDFFKPYIAAADAQSTKNQGRRLLSAKDLSQMAAAINSTIASLAVQTEISKNDACILLKKADAPPIGQFVSSSPAPLAILLAQGGVQPRDFDAAGVDAGDNISKSVYNQRSSPGLWTLPILRTALCRAIAARLTGKNPLAYSDPELDNIAGLFMAACRTQAEQEIRVPAGAESYAKDINTIPLFYGKSVPFPSIQGPKVGLVYGMEDALAALSLRMQTLEPYRLPYEPHRWSISALYAPRFAATVDAKLNPSQLGKRVKLSEEDAICRAALEYTDTPEGKQHMLGLTSTSGDTTALLASGLLAFVRSNLSGTSPPPFPVSVVLTELPASRFGETEWSQPTMQLSLDVVLRPLSMTPFLLSRMPVGLSCGKLGAPSPAIIMLRSKLHAHQRALRHLWSFALPSSVIVVAPETGADVNASLQQHAALLKTNPSLAVASAFAWNRWPFTRDDLLTGWKLNADHTPSVTGSALSPGCVPLVSGETKESLTVLADAASYGGPQPYRPPVAKLASHIGQMVLASRPKTTEVS